MECLLPGLDFVSDPISLDEALRTKIRTRYRELLEQLLAIPLWSTYYNTQIKLWIKQTHPKLNTAPDLSAANIVRYLVQTYAALSNNRFLFQETNRNAFVGRLTSLKSKNYLLGYLGGAMVAARPTGDSCRPTLFEEVAALIDRCLHTPGCRRPVEEALFVAILPKKVKREFNQQFLEDLQTQYAKKNHLNDKLLSQIDSLEARFFQAHNPSAAAYLNAAATPLVFLNADNVLGEVSQGFKDKVRGGAFQVKDLFLAKLFHLWPELGVTRHRIPEAAFNRFQQIACNAIHQEIQTILGHSGEKEEEKEGWGGRVLANLEELCRTRDLKHSVFYYTGGKFVCFREDEVWRDIAQNKTQKYPAGFLAKMKARAAGPLPSPIVGATGREGISRQRGQDGRAAYKKVDLDATSDSFAELERRFGDWGGKPRKRPRLCRSTG